jgi:hypothetical protein
MYHDHPEEAGAYTVPNQFMFGTELLVAPITTPADRAGGVGSVTAWLPAGEWVDVFTGLRYTGDRTIVLHRPIDSIPVLARAGGILPMLPADDVSFGADLPETVEVHVYAGADGELTLVEDRDDERWARTRLTYADGTGELTVHDVEGDPATLPQGRRYDVVVEGIAPVDVPGRVFAILDRAQVGLELKAATYDLVRETESPAHAALALQALDLPPSLLGAVSEVLLAHVPGR